MTGGVLSYYGGSGGGVKAVGFQSGNMISPHVNVSDVHTNYILSFWVYFVSFSGNQDMYVLNNFSPSPSPSVPFQAAINQSGLRIAAGGTNGSMMFHSNVTFTSGEWHNILIKQSVATGQTQCLMDGVALGGNQIIIGSSVGFSGVTQWEVGARGSSNRISGYLSELYYDINTSLDINDLAAQEKFIKDGKPANLGNNGEIPSGALPLMYMRGGVSEFPVNRGRGGNQFTVGGVLTPYVGEVRL